MKTVGILGGGQLARMLALAGYPLGMQFLCYEPTLNTCANQVARVVNGDYADESALLKFAQAVDCVTIETENIPLNCAQFIARHRPLLPNIDALKVTQDRLLEKETLQALGIPTAKFRKINSWEELKSALTDFQFPCVIKTRRNGYDGKGQALLRNMQDAELAWQQLKNQDLILEAFVDFECEVSLISVRSNNEIKFYPLIKNEHRDGILRISHAPLIKDTLQTQAENYAKLFLEKFNYIGVLTIEFFVKNNQLIANEVAPRVHNSGHWTIEGATTSQFENHLRAICNLPLGATDAVGYSAMFNIIGTEPSAEKILAINGAHYHTYGKEPRPGRKLGHITINQADETQLARTAFTYQNE